jgi:hypothetical protein
VLAVIALVLSVSKAGEAQGAARRAIRISEETGGRAMHAAAGHRGVAGRALPCHDPAAFKINLTPTIRKGTLRHA